MAIYYSPRTITDDLVLYYDAANFKSHISGSTNVYNLMNNDRFVGSLQNGVKHVSGSFFELDGSDDRIAISCTGNSEMNLSNSTTILCVELPVVTGGQRNIMSYRGYGGGSMYVGKNNSVLFTYYDGLSSPGLTIGALSANTMIHCAITCDSTNSLLTHFINGIKYTPASRTGFNSTNGTGTVYLGHDAGGTGEYMVGKFYTFQHYKRVLTDDEILQNYNAIKGRFGR